jgi:hypothetical protein
MAERVVRIANILGWIAVIVIAVLSLVPGAYRPHTSLPRQAEHIVCNLPTHARRLAMAQIRQGGGSHVDLRSRAGNRPELGARPKSHGHRCHQRLGGSDYRRMGCLGCLAALASPELRAVSDRGRL